MSLSIKKLVGTRIRRLIDEKVCEYLDNCDTISEIVESAIDTWIEDNLDEVVSNALEE